MAGHLMWLRDYAINLQPKRNKVPTYQWHGQGSGVCEYSLGNSGLGGG